MDAKRFDLRARFTRFLLMALVLGALTAFLSLRTSQPALGDRGPDTLPPPPDPLVVSIDVDRGANSVYQVGDPVRIHYYVSHYAAVQIYECQYGQNCRMILDQEVDPPGGNIYETVAEPTGWDSLRIEAEDPWMAQASAGTAFFITIPIKTQPPAGMCRVTWISSNTYCTGEFGLASPQRQVIFPGYQSQPAQRSVDIGPYNPDTSLTFYLHTNGSFCGDHEYLSTSPNARIQRFGGNNWRINWSGTPLNPNYQTYNELVADVQCGQVVQQPDPKVSRSLTFSPNPATAGDTVTASFKIHNYGNAPWNPARVCVAGVPNGGGFPCDTGVSIPSGGERDFSPTLTFQNAGSFNFEVNWQDASNNWHQVPADSGVNRTGTVTVNQPDPCANHTGWGPIEFPVYPYLRILADGALVRIDTEYGIIMSGTRCTKAVFLFAPVSDTDTQLDAAVMTIRKQNGDTRLTMNRKGEITRVDAGITLSQNHDQHWGFTPVPWPTIHGDDTVHADANASDFMFSQNRTWKWDGQLKPAPTVLLYVVAVGVAAVVIVHFVGVAAAAVAIKAALALAVVPMLSSANVPSSVAAVQQHITTAPPAVVADVGTVFTPAFVNVATIDDLAVSTVRVRAGQIVSFNGLSFTPNGRVSVTLTSMDDPLLQFATEVTADPNGVISGQIQVPWTARSGRWLVAAIDAQSMYTQLQQLANGQLTDLHYYLRATDVDVAAACSGDVNADGVVNATDFSILMSEWQHTCSNGSCQADFNNDGVVNADDYAILMANWQHRCSP